MEAEFIQYEQALALRELGFDEPCFGYYSNGNLVYGNHTNNEMQRFRYSAPTFSQAFRWFREKYKELKFFIKEEDFREGLYEYDIKDVLCASGYKTYEEAELECLKKLIEIVKNK